MCLVFKDFCAVSKLHITFKYVLCFYNKRDLYKMFTFCFIFGIHFYEKYNHKTKLNQLFCTNYSSILLQLPTFNRRPLIGKFTVSKQPNDLLLIKIWIKFYHFHVFEINKSPFLFKKSPLKHMLITSQAWNAIYSVQCKTYGKTLKTGKL